MPTTRTWLKWPVILVALIVIIGLWIGSTYNSLVKQNEGISTQWAQVEAQYQRRFDLIPNLVNSVKGAMKQEQTVFNDIATARTQYAGATTPDQKAAAASQVEGALGRLLVVMENYPTLKSIDVVQGLTAELAGTENRISVERMRYNDLVKNYNVSVKTFPSSLVAKMFGFGPHTFFEAQKEAQTAPTVNF